MYVCMYREREIDRSHSGVSQQSEFKCKNETWISFNRRKKQYHLCRVKAMELSSNAPDMPDYHTLLSLVLTSRSPTVLAL